MPDRYRSMEILDALKIGPDTIERALIWTKGLRIEEIHPRTGKRSIGINVPTLIGPLRVSEGEYLALRSGKFVKMCSTEVENTARWEKVRTR